MRNLKKILALVLALMMTLSLMVTASAKTFTDTGDIDSKYAEAVDVLSGMGVFKGTGDGSTFSPDKTITRAEVAAIIYRIVTGDVTDVQAGIYADYNEFEDVSKNIWYAGYVNYCANNKYIMGDGAGHFYPAMEINGYQVLAMILRAIGYGQNGEFEGAGWEVRVTGTAKNAGLLNGITEGTLAAPASREMVAQILFNDDAATTEIYTPALGYYTPTFINGANNASLGTKNFGLTSAESYIVGNQATGEAATKLGYTTAGTGVVANYTAANTPTNKAFAITTSLEQFGHQTKVWYSANSAVNGVYQTVYATFDKATNSSITTAEYTALTAPEKAVYTAASAFYDDFNAGAVVAAPAVYNMVVNNANGTKALVGLFLTVDLYTAINNYITSKTVSFHSAGTVAQAKVDGFNTLALGTYVNLNRVVGTQGSDATKTDGFYKYNVTALGITQGTVSYVNSTTKAITLNGNVVNYSYDPLVATANAVGLTVPTPWSFVTTYNVYTDILGNYVAAMPVNTVNYLKATYAYYQTNVVDGSIVYYIQGVDMTGTQTTVQMTAATPAAAAAAYNALTCTKLNWMTNTIINVGNTQDLVLAPAANGAYTIAHTLSDGHTTPCTTVQAVVANAGLQSMQNLNGGTATITATTVSLGAARNYFVDGNTAFYYVTGYGATLKVDAYAGITALLNGNSSCTLPADAVVKASQVFSANIGTNNYHVDAVLIAGTPALTGVSNLVYVPTATVLGTNAAGNVYDIYLNGAPATGVLVPPAGGIAPQTFYTYTVDALGRYVLGTATTGRVEDAALNTANAAGSAYLYVTDSTSAQRPVASDAKVINLTNVVNVPTTTAELVTALETNNITVDAEIVNNVVVNLYITGYTAK